jgi:hypothetical protein
MAAEAAGATREPHHDDPGQGQPDRLVPGQRREPQQDPERDDAPVVQAQPDAQAAAAGGDLGRGAKDPRPEEARGQDDGPEEHRRIGQDRVEDERQEDGRRQPRPDGQGPGPAHREPALDGDVGRQSPGQDGHEPADDDRRPLGRGEGGAEREHREGGEERRQREPDLERRTWELEGWGAVAPDRVAHEAAALHEVAGDADVVGGVPAGKG